MLMVEYSAGRKWIVDVLTRLLSQLPELIVNRPFNGQLVLMVDFLQLLFSCCLLGNVNTLLCW